MTATPRPPADDPEEDSRYKSRADIRGHNLPEEDHLLRLVRQTLAANDAVLDAHDAEAGEECDCTTCYDLRGFGWVLHTAESMLHCGLCFLPEDLAAIRARTGPKRQAAPEPDPVPPADQPAVVRFREFL